MALTLTGLGRVFLNANGLGGKFSYHSCMKIDGVDKSLGDVTAIYCPDPKRYDEFIEVATIKGADGRATSTLTGYLPIDALSPLEQVYNQGCQFDIQVHYGTCSRPDAFNEFSSAIILKDVRLTSYALSTLTARTPDERAVVDETAAISIGGFYRVLPIKQNKLPVTYLPANAFAFGVGNAGVRSCGDNCDAKSTGCDTWIVGVVNASDSLSFAFTTDGGVTWTFTSAKTTVLHNSVTQAANMTIAGGYLYFSMTQGTSTYFYRASVSSILAGNADSAQIMTNVLNTYVFEISASDNYIWYAGSKNGNSFLRAYNTATGEFTDFTNDSEEFRAVNAYSDDVVVAAGENGVVYYSNTFGVFSETVAKPATSYVTGLKVFSSTRWLAATAAGTFLTTDAGTTWTQVASSTNWGRLSFYDNLTGYLNSTLGTMRTVDGGNTWHTISSVTTYNTNDLAVCEYDPNTYFLAGGDPGSGFVYKGNP